VKNLWVEGCRVMVEGLPVGAVPVPIESRSCPARLNPKVFDDLGLNFFVQLAAVGVFRHQVATFVPTYPLGILYAVALAASHFFDQFVVQRPIIFIAQEVGNYHDIVML